MDKKKKIGLIIAGCVELAIIIFALVISIVVVVTFNSPDDWGTEPAHKMNLEQNGPFIGFFQNNSTAFFCIILIPVFAILALDIIYLVVAATKRASNLSDAEVNAIQEQARAQARAEVMKELQAEADAAKKDEEAK